MIGELDRQLWGLAQPGEAIDDPEETRWLERARAGEDAAFNWLVARYRMRAVRLAAHCLRRPDEAEDVAQEAFIRAFRSLRSFQGRGRFYTWLYHIIIRVCLDRMRSARWKVEVLVSEPESLSEPEEGIETRLLVEDLLDRLSPPIRAALVLRELEGLEYEEIARILEIPIGTVRSRLNAARSQFRELWTRAMEEADHV